MAPVLNLGAAVLAILQHNTAHSSTARHSAVRQRHATRQILVTPTMAPVAKHPLLYARCQLVSVAATTIL
jgi:hypothetical protein